MSYLQESHYNINVAKHGKHHFRILIVGITKAKEIFKEIKDLYSDKCYSVDVTYWDISGTMMDW